MLNLLDKLRRSEKGDALVEFAFAIPFLVLMFVGLTEMGRAFLQANAVEKGMRAAAVYAARVDDPMGITSMNIIENLAKTGTLDGSGAFLVAGWQEVGAALDVSQSYYELDGTNVPVIRLTASVPFEPLSAELAGLVGLGGFTITLSHEQSYVDD